ncbi:MAG: hypothetical protein ABI686_10950 [Acidobacteriota bacterium]
MSSEKRDEITTYANKILESRLTAKSENLAKKSVKANQQKNIADQSEKLISEFVSMVKQDDIEFAKTNIIEFLQGISPAPENSFQDFIILQTELINWAERHHFKKDWLLRYAYFFLSEYSSNPEIKLNEIIIPTQNIGSLKAQSFEFSFAGWSAEDSIEAYKKRVTESFNKKLQRYFLYVSDHCNLEENKHVTRPRDSDYESIKRLIAWNEGIAQSEIAIFFGRSLIVVEKALTLLSKTFGLPKRIGLPGRKKRHPIFDKRLAQIKAAKIP